MVGCGAIRSARARRGCDVAVISCALQFEVLESSGYGYDQTGVGVVLDRVCWLCWRKMEGSFFVELDEVEVGSRNGHRGEWNVVDSPRSLSVCSQSPIGSNLPRLTVSSPHADGRPLQSRVSRPSVQHTLLSFSQIPSYFVYTSVLLRFL